MLCSTQATSKSLFSKTQDEISEKNVPNHKRIRQVMCFNIYFICCVNYVVITRFNSFIAKLKNKHTKATTTKQFYFLTQKNIYYDK